MCYILIFSQVYRKYIVFWHDVNIYDVNIFLCIDIIFYYFYSLIFYFTATAKLI